MIMNKPDEKDKKDEQNQQNIQENEIYQDSFNENDRFFELDIMGEKIKILKAIGIKIPFIESLIDTKSKFPVIINTVSPDFFRILIDFLKNSRTVENFKTKIEEFDKEKVEIWLKYLGMDKLHKQIYGCKYVDKMLVIIDAMIVHDSKSSFKDEFLTFPMCDGNYIAKIDVDNTLVLVSTYKCTEENVSMKNGDVNILYGFMIKSKYKNYVFFRKSCVIEKDGLYFITFKNAVKYEIISNCDKIRKEFKDTTF